MLKRILTLSSVLLLLGAAAVFAATANFNVSVTIRQPIVVSCPAGTGDLVFGTVDAVAGTYTINPVTGTQLTNGHAANCTVQGEAGLTPTTASTPASTVVTGPGGPPAPTITVTLTPQAAAAFTGGVDNFFIGGSITLVGGETSGTYTGTSTLTVIY